MTPKKELKRDYTAYTKFGLYLVILILINLVGGNLFFRVDLTANNLYSLSRASKRVVSTLGEPMTINVFFSKNLPAPYNVVETYLRDLLDEYAAHSKRYLSYRFFNVTASEGDLSEEAEENRQKAQDYGIYPVNVQSIERDEAKVQRAYMGMVFIHGDIIERIPAVTSTEGLEYKITTTVQKMNNKISALLNLENKVEVQLVQSSSLNQVASQVGLEGLDGLREQIRTIVEEQNEKAYGQLEFVFVDPTAGPGADIDLSRFQRFGLRWPELNQPDGNMIPAGEGLLALGMQYGDKTVERELLSRNLKLTGGGLREAFELIDMDQIRTYIEGNIDNLINIHEEIGYLSSNETLPLSSALPPQFQQFQPQQGNLTNFNGLLSDNYTVTQVDLKEDEIPASLDTLIIAGPKEEFSDWELFQIDQFLMEGKSLAVFAEAFQEIQQNPNQQMYGMNQSTFLPLNTGLDKLLDHYGVNVKKAYVMDENCYINRDQTSGETPFYFVPIIKSENINHRLDFLSNIKELIMIKMSPLEVNEERIKESGLENRPLFSSSSGSWEMAGQINLMPWMIRPPADEEEKGGRLLAVLLEGEFPSYFADKPVPEKPKQEETESGDESEQEETVETTPEEEPQPQETPVTEEKGILTKGRPGRILLIGSAEILKDNIIDEQGANSNAVFLLNSLDYLNDRGDIAVMRGKNQRFNPLKDTKAGTRSFVKILNIAGLPALVILLGFLVWARRKTKRRAIQAMFAQATRK